MQYHVKIQTTLFIPIVNLSTVTIMPKAFILIVNLSTVTIMPKAFILIVNLSTVTIMPKARDIISQCTRLSESRVTIRQDLLASSCVISGSFPVQVLFIDNILGNFAGTEIYASLNKSNDVSGKIVSLKMITTEGKKLPKGRPWIQIF